MKLPHQYTFQKPLNVRGITRVLLVCNYYVYLFVIIMYTYLQLLCIPICNYCVYLFVIIINNYLPILCILICINYVYLYVIIMYTYLLLLYVIIIIILLCIDYVTLELFTFFCSTVFFSLSFQIFPRYSLKCFFFFFFGLPHLLATYPF